MVIKYIGVYTNDLRRYTLKQPKGARSNMVTSLETCWPQCVVRDVDLDHVYICGEGTVLGNIAPGVLPADPTSLNVMFSDRPTCLKRPSNTRKLSK